MVGCIAASACGEARDDRQDALVAAHPCQGCSSPTGFRSGNPPVHTGVHDTVEALDQKRRRQREMTDDRAVGSPAADVLDGDLGGGQGR